MASDYEVLSDLQDHACRIAIESGVDQASANKLGDGLREHFRKHWGGQLVYFTKSKSLAERDIEIYRKWNGKNKADLIREYGISEGRFYELVKSGKALDADKRGGRLL